MAGTPVEEFDHWSQGVTRLVNVNTTDVPDVTLVDRRSIFGNPFVLEEDGGEYTRRESVAEYIDWFADRIEHDEFRTRVYALAGETLGCHCVPKLCHGHVIMYYLVEGDVPDDVDEIQRWRSERLTVCDVGEVSDSG